MHVQMEGMDVVSHSSSKKYKTLLVGKDILIFDLEEFDYQIEQGGKEGCLIQEEMSHQNESFDSSSFNQTLSQFAFQSQPPLGVLNLQSYCYINANASHFKSKNELLEQYS